MINYVYDLNVVASNYVSHNHSIIPNLHIKYKMIYKIFLIMADFSDKHD